ncbi:prepilin peptidase [Granulicatella balaenopterae]|uniref:prepilin peptidase n=1 Tax=Granulicatella balaenopterae TaxID=137733 RepID=UPI0015A629D5|nr:A24 family peptidase [Granulicatella balaenopterae]
MGIVFGSFINCLSWRMANHESVRSGRSHCTSCGHILAAKDLVPIFSYLFLKGRCRYCGIKIHPRYMLTELVLGLAFVAVVAVFGISWQALSYLVLSCLLLGLSLVDLAIYEIPDSFIIWGIVNWLVFLPLQAGVIGPSELASPKALVPLEYLMCRATDGLLGGFIIAGSLLVLSIIFDKLSGKESLGGGDIKLFFMTGLYMGLFESLFCLILSCVMGILFSVLVKKNRIPFGPCISVAVFITLLIGTSVTTWYLSLF